MLNRCLLYYCSACNIRIHKLSFKLLFIKMGRKIPAKKHRGVKDPLIQQARRLQSLKGKINAPPKDPDEQPVPRSLTELFAFQSKEQKTNEKKNKNKKILEDGKVKPRLGKNPIAKLKQLPGESGRGFSLRINSAIRALNEPLENLDYTSLQEEDGEDRRGERMAAQRERRQRKNKRGSRPGEDEEEGDRPGRVQRLALKKRAQKEKAKQEASRPELVYDRVSFGDVTHAPPSISVLPRHCQRGDGAERPGRRQLLLTGLLRGEGAAGGVAGGGAEQRERERRERARLDVVAAYRAVKKQRRVDEKKKRPHS